MKLRKSPEALVAVFDEVMPGPPATKRKMFGFPAGFVNGNMFMGLFEDSMILRLPAELREELIQQHGAKPFAPMAGRVMKEYVVVPERLLHDRKQISSWIGKALAYGESLEPKSRKTKSKAEKAAAQTAKRKSPKTNTKGKK
jgi:TfoX/Sxy family transcriptional regulator of competence genes